LGIIGSLAICTVLYILVAIVLTGIVPYTEFVGVNDPLATALNRMVTADGNIFSIGGFALTPGSAAFIVSVGAIVGLTSVLLVFQLGLPRIFFSMSRDGLMPKSFTKIHSKFKTPYIITIITGIIIASASALTPLAAAAELANMGTLFAFALVCVAVVMLRKSDPNTPRAFRTPGVPWLPAAGVIMCVLLMASLSPITIIRFVAWMGLGVAVYGFYGASHSHIRGEQSVTAEIPVSGSASGK
jgi:APA family basic amino acid/polyamine antiporter